MDINDDYFLGYDDSDKRGKRGVIGDQLSLMPANSIYGNWTEIFVRKKRSYEKICTILRGGAIRYCSTDSISLHRIFYATVSIKREETEKKSAVFSYQSYFHTH